MAVASTTANTATGFTFPAAGASSASGASQSVSGAASTAGTGGSGAASATTAAEAEDRFLKLLVAQMTNQDPTNPLDNAQVTTQMAQISTVSGIEKLNTALSQWMSQSSAVQQLDGAGLVGRQVLVEGATLTLSGGTERTAGVRGGYELSRTVGEVRVDVLDAAGNNVATIRPTATTAGVHSFEWDGRDKAGRALADGTYTITVSGGEAKAMDPVTALQSATVGAVLSSSAGAKVELSNGAQRALSDVKGIL